MSDVNDVIMQNRGESIFPHTRFMNADAIDDDVKALRIVYRHEEREKRNFRESQNCDKLAQIRRENSHSLSYKFYELTLRQLAVLSLSKQTRPTRKTNSSALSLHFHTPERKRNVLFMFIPNTLRT